MEVTKDTFPCVLPHLKQYLDACDFVALDEEMTGISIPENPESFLDSLATSYDKKRRVADMYSIIQIGLCFFEKVKDAEQTDGSVPRYVVRPFNFYVFPSLHRSVVLSPSAVDFNRKYNMNFQRWIYEGIGYCNAEQEAAFMSELQAAQVAKDTPPVLTNQDEIALAELTYNKIHAWVLETNNTSRELSLPDTKSRAVQRVVSHRVYSEMLPRLAPPLPSGTTLTFSYRAGGRWLVSRGPGLDESAKEEAKRIAHVGFRDVFRMLVDAKKPIIGHHCLMDILFMISSFDRAAPASLTEFQSYMSCNFPLVWDTKVLCSADPSFENMIETGTHLMGLLDHFSPVGSTDIMRDLIFPLGFERYSTQLHRRSSLASNRTQAHEAAFDALCTGYVYIRLMHALAPAVLERSRNVLAVFGSVQGINLSGTTDSAITRWMPSVPTLLVEYEKGAIQRYDLQASVGNHNARVLWFEETQALLQTTDAAVDDLIFQLNMNKKLRTVKPLTLKCLS